MFLPPWIPHVWILVSIPYENFMLHRSRKQPAKAASDLKPIYGNGTNSGMLNGASQANKNCLGNGFDANSSRRVTQPQAQGHVDCKEPDMPIQKGVQYVS